MHLAVTVGQVDVPDDAGQFLDVVERRAGEVQVRDVGVRANGRVADLVDEACEFVDVLEQCLLERLELEHDLEALRLRIFAGLLNHVLGHVPDRVFRENLAIPVVLPDDEQDVAGIEEGPLVDVRLDPVQREPAHRRVEVDDAEGDTDDRSDR